MSNLNIDCRFVEFPLDLVERQYLVNNFANSHFKENLVYFMDIQINVLSLRLQMCYARNEVLRRTSRGGGGNTSPALKMKSVFEKAFCPENI